MKKTFFSFAIIGASLLASCSAEVEETENEGTEQTSENSQEDAATDGPSIVGTWQQTGLDMGVEIPATEQEMFEETQKATIENTSYTFSADGTFQLKTWMLGRTVEYGGTYTAEGDVLNTTVEGEETSFNYSITDSELVITQEDGEATITMTFERQ